MTIIVPLSFRTFSNVDNLGVFMPYFIDVAGKCLNNSFKSVNALNGLCVDTLEKMNKLINKLRFLFTISDQRSFFGLNVFFDDRDVDSNRGMV